MNISEKKRVVVKLGSSTLTHKTGRLNLLPMMTDRFPFAEVKEAFGAVTARNESRVKVMVDFE